MPRRKKPEHISQKNWDEAEIPEWTAADFARAKPAKEVLPRTVYNALVRRRGQRGRQKTPTKIPVQLRVDPDVLDAYKAQGRSWQTRMNDALRRGLRD